MQPIATISSSLEDYLEAIAEIIDSERHAHAKEIADKLKVSMSAVTNALQALSARGLIRYQPHSPVLLTTEGAERAAVIRHRHNAMQRFFSDLLLLNETEASDAACKIEHIIGEKVLSRIVLLAESVKTREDCAGLRDYLGKTMQQICPETGDDLISLDILPKTKRAVVVKVAENLRGLRKFADLGLVPGTLIEMEGSAPFGDLLRIKVMGSSLSLRSKDASHIWVRPANPAVLKEVREKGNIIL